MSLTFPSPTDFFDLEEWSHLDLFSLSQPVWETVKNIKPYLDSCSLGNIECEIPPQVTLIHPDQISIGPGTVIESGAFIEGPCIIGKKCLIRHGAYLRSHLVVGDFCTLGHCSELKHSLLLSGAAVPHFNYVGDSLIGNRVNLGAGVICANLRLDQKEVTIRVGGEKISSGMKKLGAVIGDGSQLGCHSIVNPGILLRKNTRSQPSYVWRESNWKQHV